MKQSSGQQDEAVVKQCSSEQKDFVVVQRCRGIDRVVVMHPYGDETIEFPPLDLPGKKKKEQSKQNDSIIRWNANCDPGLDHSGQNK